MPMINWGQVPGRMAPSEAMSNNMGRSKQCVKIGMCACRARVRSGVEDGEVTVLDAPGPGACQSATFQKKTTAIRLEASSWPQPK